MLIPQQKLTPRIIDLVRGLVPRSAELNRYIPKPVTWVGSGRSGLYHILKEIKVQNVGIGSFTCHVVDSIIKKICKPIYVDSGVHMDIDNIKDKISLMDALIVPHNFGFMSEMDKIKILCRKNNTILIEDCAQALGSKYNLELAGSYGDFGFYSFGISKNIGFCGGAVIGDLVAPKFPAYPVRKLAKVISEVIISPVFFNSHFYPLVFKLLQSELGKKQESLTYNISKFAKNVIMTQFNKYDSILKLRTDNAVICSEELEGVIDFVNPIKGNQPSWLYFVLLAKNRNDLRKKLLRENVDINKLRTFQDISKNGVLATKIQRENMTFALYRSRDETEYIIKKIKKVVNG